MCVVKTPKVNTASTEREKPLPILTNPILDGVDPTTKSLRVGRNSLRIEKGSNSIAPSAPAIASVRIGRSGQS